jgi:glutamate carboxypeptidase
LGTAACCGPRFTIARMFTGQPCRGTLGAALIALAAASSLSARPLPTTGPARAQAGAPAQAPAASRVDSGRLLKDLGTLAAPEMEGRLTGTAGNKRAQALILERFRALKLQPVNGSFEQKFSFTSNQGANTRFPDATNLFAIVPGTVARDRYVVVSAHYDHLGVKDRAIYHGADDNASGVAVLLAVARWFSARPPRVSLLLVAFDGEEEGLEGAKAFIAHPPVAIDRIDAIVNMDMVGRGDKNVIYVAGTTPYPALKPIVQEAAKGRTIEVRFGHDRPGVAEEDWTQSSDHGPFHTAHVPFLYFGVEDHADYHQPTDTADKIPRAFYAEAAELVLATVQRLTETLPTARGGRVTPEEQAVVTAVDAANPQALALLERVVNINSGSMNFAGVRAVGEVFRGELDALGFTTRWIDGAPFNRAGHLVGERRGSGRRVLLIGHLDTVFEPDSPFQRFQRIDERTARGPGIIDMKGGDVVMIHALKALHAVKALDRLHVTVVMTGDEELTGEPLSAARAALIDAAKQAEVAIGFEDGPGDPRTAVIARRGTTGWQLRVKAKAAHSSQVFREDIGAGAIYEAARILTGFRETLAAEPHLTFNPGVMLGGTSVDLDTALARGTAAGKENVIAEQAVVMGDLRALTPDQFERAKERMLKIAAASLPHSHATLTFEDGYPPLAPTAGNERLLALYDQASRDVGAGPVTAVDPDRAGAADVSFAAGHVKRILDGIGLMGHGDHTPEETADLSTLPSQTKRAALLLYRLGTGAE